MRADMEKRVAGMPPLYHLVLRVQLEEFEQWSHAALAKGKILTDWAIDCIKEAYQADISLENRHSSPESANIDPGKSPLAALPPPEIESMPSSRGA